jgi:tetratricopeptide (TPR) repeat protein
MREARIAKLREFLANNPQDSFSRYALALEYDGQGETERAVTLLEELLRDDPTYVPAYQQLGYAYQKLGRRDDAIALLKRGMEVAAAQGDLHARGEMQEALDS